MLDPNGYINRTQKKYFDMLAGHFSWLWSEWNTFSSGFNESPTPELFLKNNISHRVDRVGSDGYLKTDFSARLLEESNALLMDINNFWSSDEAKQICEALRDT